MLILITLGVALAMPIKAPVKPVCSSEQGLYFISDISLGTMHAKYISCSGETIRSMSVFTRDVIGEYEREHGLLSWRI